MQCLVSFSCFWNTVFDFFLQDIKAASLRTLTSIVHLERTPKLSNIIDCTGTASYHGFLPVLVRNCIQAMIGEKTEGPFVKNFSIWCTRKFDTYNGVLFVNLLFWFPRSPDGTLPTPVCHCTLLIPLPLGKLWCWRGSPCFLWHDGSPPEGISWS